MNDTRLLCSKNEQNTAHIHLLNEKVKNLDKFHKLNLRQKFKVLHNLDLFDEISSKTNQRATLM